MFKAAHSLSLFRRGSRVSRRISKRGYTWLASASFATALTLGIALPGTRALASGMPPGMRMPASTPHSKLVVLTHRKTVHVAIENLAFAPARIVVSPGTRIVWTNKDQLAHTTTADQGLWESGQLNSGDDFSRAFKRTGTFKYHCTIHPFMHGAITVSSS